MPDDRRRCAGPPHFRPPTMAHKNGRPGEAAGGTLETRPAVRYVIPYQEQHGPRRGRSRRRFSLGDRSNSAFVGAPGRLGPPGTMLCAERCT